MAGAEVPPLTPLAPGYREMWIGQRPERRQQMHPNEQWLRTAYDDFTKGGIGAVIDLFDDDIQWHVGGRHRVAGDYKGKVEVSQFFQKLMEISEGTFDLEVHDVLANEHHGVALVRQTARVGDRPWDVNFIHVWHIRNGKLAEAWIQTTNQYLDDEVWS